MAVLQAWPGRGFWQGRVGQDATAGTLPAMVQQMAQTPQPHLFAFVVAGLAGSTRLTGGRSISSRSSSWRPSAPHFSLAGLELCALGVAAGIVLCLADWMLIEDLGFLGGVGTDPNSMIPMVVVFTAGYLALHPAPAGATWP